MCHLWCSDTSSLLWMSGYLKRGKLTLEMINDDGQSMLPIRLICMMFTLYPVQVIFVWPFGQLFINHSFTKLDQLSYSQLYHSHIPQEVFSVSCLCLWLVNLIFFEIEPFHLEGRGYLVEMVVVGHILSRPQIESSASILGSFVSRGELFKMTMWFFRRHQWL